MWKTLLFIVTFLCHIPLSQAADNNIEMVDNEEGNLSIPAALNPYARIEDEILYVSLDKDNPKHKPGFGSSPDDYIDRLRKILQWEEHSSGKPFSYQEKKQMKEFLANQKGIFFIFNKFEIANGLLGLLKSTFYPKVVGFSFNTGCGLIAEHGGILSRNLGKYPNLTSLDLGQASLTQGGLVAMAGALKSLSLLRHLNLSKSSEVGTEHLTSILETHIGLQSLALDCTKETGPILKLLPGMTHLTTFSFADNSLVDNDLERIVILSGLTSLDLSHNKLTAFTGLSGLTKLTTLRLNNNQFMNPYQLFRDLIGLPLTELDLSSNTITHLPPSMNLPNLKTLRLTNLEDPEFNLSKRVNIEHKPEPVLEIIKNWTTLETLDLSHSRGLFGQEILLNFIRALENMGCLTSLNLNHTRIGDKDKGALELSHTLRSLTKLTHVYLANLSSQGFTGFVRGLSYLQKLKILDLSDNKGDGTYDNGPDLEQLWETLEKWPDLQHIDLHGNNIHVLRGLKLLGLKPIPSIDIFDEETKKLFSLIEEHPINNDNIVAYFRDGTLSEDHFNPIVGKYLERHPDLTTLNLTGSNLGNKGLKTLVKLLIKEYPSTEKYPSIEELILDSCNISEKKYLIDLLEAKTPLKTLSAQDNNGLVFDTEKLWDCVLSHKTLLKLSILPSFNETNLSDIKLAKIFRIKRDFSINNQTIREVMLHNLEKIGGGGIPFMSAYNYYYYNKNEGSYNVDGYGWQNHFWNFEDINIGDKGAEHLTTLASAGYLIGNNLCLKNTGLSDQSCLDLVRALFSVTKNYRQQCWVGYLDLSGHSFSTQTISEIENILNNVHINSSDIRHIILLTGSVLCKDHIHIDQNIKNLINYKDKDIYLSGINFNPEFSLDQYTKQYSANATVLKGIVRYSTSLENLTIDNNVSGSHDLHISSIVKQLLDNPFTFTNLKQLTLRGFSFDRYYDDNKYGVNNCLMEIISKCPSLTGIYLGARLTDLDVFHRILSAAFKSTSLKYLSLSGGIHSRFYDGQYSLSYIDDTKDISKLFRNPSFESLDLSGNNFIEDTNKKLTDIRKGLPNGKTLSF